MPVRFVFVCVLLFKLKPPPKKKKPQDVDIHWQPVKKLLCRRLSPGLSGPDKRTVAKVKVKMSHPPEGVSPGRIAIPLRFGCFQLFVASTGQFLQKKFTRSNLHYRFWYLPIGRAGRPSWCILSSLSVAKKKAPTRAVSVRDSLGHSVNSDTQPGKHWAAAACDS